MSNKPLSSHLNLSWDSLLPYVSISTQNIVIQWHFHNQKNTKNLKKIKEHCL